MALNAEAIISLISLFLNLAISLLVIWQNQKIIAARRCEIIFTKSSKLLSKRGMV